MWFARLTSLARSGRLSGLSLMSGAVAAVLIIGGIAFAAQGARNDQVLGPDRKTASQNTTTTDVVPPSIGGFRSPSTATPGSTSPSTQPPVTIVGPNGETFTIPTVTTPNTTTDRPAGDDGNRNPTLTQPSVTTTPPPVDPNETNTTTTTLRPVPNQEQPQLDVSVAGGSMPEDPVVSLDINVSDSDGYITRIDVIWDAGEAPENVASYGGNACDDPPPSSHSLNVQHTYSVPGTHSVSVAVTTVSCDGTTQQASRTASVTSGGTTASTVDVEVDV